MKNPLESRGNRQRIEHFLRAQHAVPIGLAVRVTDEKRKNALKPGKRRKGVIVLIGVRPDLEGQEEGSLPCTHIFSTFFVQRLPTVFLDNTLYADDKLTVISLDERLLSRDRPSRRPERSYPTELFSMSWSTAITPLNLFI